jgi:hypothetical protein
MKRHRKEAPGALRYTMSVRFALRRALYRFFNWLLGLLEDD